MEPLYEVGSFVLYMNSKNKVQQSVEVLAVHVEDEQPYYTIRMPDGSEKQTTLDKLSPLGSTVEVADLQYLHAIAQSALVEKRRIQADYRGLMDSVAMAIQASPLSVSIVTAQTLTIVVGRRSTAAASTPRPRGMYGWMCFLCSVTVWILNYLMSDSDPWMLPSVRPRRGVSRRKRV